MEKIVMPAPCKNCPFRKDLGDNMQGWLGRRIDDIIEETVTGDKHFTCHKTLKKKKSDERVCAGNLLLQKNAGLNANKTTRLLIALGAIKPDMSDIGGHDTVFNSIEDCKNFHKHI